MGIEAATKEEIGFYVRLAEDEMSQLQALTRFLSNQGFRYTADTTPLPTKEVVYWVSFVGRTWMQARYQAEGFRVYEFPKHKTMLEVLVNQYDHDRSKPTLMDNQKPNRFYVHVLACHNDRPTQKKLLKEFTSRGYTLLSGDGFLSIPDGTGMYLLVDPIARTFREVIWLGTYSTPVYAFPSGELAKALNAQQGAQPTTFYLRLPNGHHTNANRQLVQDLLGKAGVLWLESAWPVTVGSTLVIGVDVSNKRYTYASANAVYDSKTPVFDFPEKGDYIQSLLNLSTLVPSRPMSSTSRKIEAHEQVFLTGSAGQLNGFIADWKEAGHEYQGVGFTFEETNNLVAYFQAGKEPLLCKMYDGGPGLEPVTKVWTTLLERAAAHQAAIPPKLGGMEVRYMGDDAPQTVCIDEEGYPAQGLEDLAAAIVRIDGLGLPINGVSLYGVKNLVSLDELTNFNQWVTRR